MIEEKVRYLDLRTTALEQDFEDLSKQLHEVSRQLSVYNSHQERFWQKDWPELKGAIDSIVTKVEMISNLSNLEGHKTALAIQALQLEALNSKSRSTEISTEQKALDWKWLGATAGSSGIIVGLLEIIKNLLPGG